jgi:hypothetical protein
MLIMIAACKARSAGGVAMSSTSPSPHGYHY